MKLELLKEQQHHQEEEEKKKKKAVKDLCYSLECTPPTMEKYTYTGYSLQYCL